MPATSPPQAGGLRLMSPIFLVLSVSLNVLFTSGWRMWAMFSKEHEPTCLHERRVVVVLAQENPITGWSQMAVDSAEVAALFNCSDNGDLYIATIPETDPNEFEYPSGSQEMTSCECYECFTCSCCTDAIDNCSANADRQELAQQFFFFHEVGICTGKVKFIPFAYQ
ncbi:hypothetical protein L7F22_055762 [Adiantum nelumboides]|nr:hypothetical protein [Adiantum nelumboides]